MSILYHNKLNKLQAITISESLEHFQLSVETNDVYTISMQTVIHITHLWLCSTFFSNLSIVIHSNTIITVNRVIVSTIKGGSKFPLSIKDQHLDVSQLQSTSIIITLAYIYIFIIKKQSVAKQNALQNVRISALRAV